MSKPTPPRMRGVKTMSKTADRLRARYDDADDAAPAEQQPIREVREQEQLWIDPAMKKELTSEYKRLNYLIDAEHDVEIDRSRHFHPVLAEYGLQTIRDMDASDFLDALEALKIV